MPSSPLTPTTPKPPAWLSRPAPRSSTTSSQACKTSGIPAKVHHLRSAWAACSHPDAHPRPPGTEWRSFPAASRTRQGRSPGPARSRSHARKLRPRCRNRPRIHPPRPGLRLRQSPRRELPAARPSRPAPHPRLSHPRRRLPQKFPHPRSHVCLSPSVIGTGCPILGSRRRPADPQLDAPHLGIPLDPGAPHLASEISFSSNRTNDPTAIANTAAILAGAHILPRPRRGPSAPPRPRATVADRILAS